MTLPRMAIGAERRRVVRARELGHRRAGPALGRAELDPAAADLGFGRGCRFRSRGTEYVSDSIMRWVSGGAKRNNATEPFKLTVLGPASLHCSSAPPGSVMLGAAAAGAHVDGSAAADRKALASSTHWVSIATWLRAPAPVLERWVAFLCQGW